ncbi:MAG: zinc-binding dehydrogenase [Ignavibacteria bacterium]|nr:zinc-binding dehydrogenase [Ignavibacteria bacterium]
MRALQCTERGLEFADLPIPIPTQQEALVRVSHAALNHRDEYIRSGKYAGIKLPCVLGSDACGEVVSCELQPDLQGQRVVLNPTLHWGDNPLAQDKHFSVLGMPHQGTLAEYICVPVQNVFEAPAHLTNVQAAALPLAAVTAWRALVVRGGIGVNDTVLITGIGGGVAAGAMQIALSLGSTVIVSSRSDAKLAQAKMLGASYGVNINNEDWKKKIAERGGVSLIIDSIGGDTVNDLCSVINPGGRIVFYGSSKGAAPDVHMQRIFWKQISLLGSTMGTENDFAEMLDFVHEREIVPIVDTVFPFEESLSAFERMVSSQQMGKIVIAL